MKYSTLFVGILGLILVAYASDADAKPVNVDVNIDTKICASGAIQCDPALGSGHTFDPATNSNHNPVRLDVLVSRDGKGIPGLVGGNFFLAVGTVPAGGPSFVLCDAMDCGPNNFKDVGTGFYSMFIDKNALAPLVNWKAGTYASTLSVVFTAGPRTFTGVALVAFTIP